VEEILDSRLRCNKLEFLVKWEGYTNENNLWELEDNCRNVRNAIAAFYRNTLRHQDELRGCNLMVSIFDLIKISHN